MYAQNHPHKHTITHTQSHKDIITHRKSHTHINDKGIEKYTLRSSPNNVGYSLYWGISCSTHLEVDTWYCGLLYVLGYQTQYIPWGRHLVLWATLCTGVSDAVHTLRSSPGTVGYSMYWGIRRSTYLEVVTWYCGLLFVLGYQMQYTPWGRHPVMWATLCTGGIRCSTHLEVVTWYCGLLFVLVYQTQYTPWGRHLVLWATLCTGVSDAVHTLRSSPGTVGYSLYWGIRRSTHLEVVTW